MLKTDNPDLAAIHAAAMDYILASYEVDSERMERCLHTDLAKRIVRANPDGGARLDSMSALSLVNYVKSRPGPTPPAQRVAKVEVLDVFEGIAAVRAEMHQWVDYMHLCQWNGEWRIVNVLWHLK